MTTLLTLTLITIVVAYCSYRHSKLMKTHNDALNSYYQNKMIEEAKKLKSLGIALTILALMIILSQLFEMLEKRNLNRDIQVKTTTHYDTRS